MPDRTAVIQPLPGIGDMIWHLPHIRALAAHWGAPVTLIAKPRSAADQIFAADPAVNQVLWMDRNPERRQGEHDGPEGITRLARTLRASGFRRAVLLHHSSTLAFILAAACIPERYGYGAGLQRLFLNRPPRLPRAMLRQHPHSQATAWLQAANITLGDPEPRLIVPARTREAVLRRMPAGKGPLVILGIGSSEPYKQWGSGCFAQLARSLADSGWQRFAIAGGVGEAMLAEQIRVGIGERAEAVPVIAWTLGELAALCSESAFYVGNDTGVMNLAAATGIPSYGLFGATAPIEHASRVIPILPPDGTPDLRAGMRRITPDNVLQTILQTEHKRERMKPV